MAIFHAMNTTCGTEFARRQHGVKEFVFACMENEQYCSQLTSKIYENGGYYD